MKGIIFDLDGTLWDATESIAKPWQETLRKNGIERSIDASDVKAVMGMTVLQIAEHFMPDTEEEKRLRIAYECCYAEIPYIKKYGGVLYPGLSDTLQELSKKYKLFIVSNCEDEYIDAFYEFHGLKKYFSDEEYIGRTGKTKGENIKLIIERNSLKSAVYVGDTEMDMKAAEYAEIPFIFAAYGFGSADRYIKKIKNIGELLDACPL